MLLGWPAIRLRMEWVLCHIMRLLLANACLQLLRPSQKAGLHTADGECGVKLGPATYLRLLLVVDTSLTDSLLVRQSWVCSSESLLVRLLGTLATFKDILPCHNSQTQAGP